MGVFLLDLAQVGVLDGHRRCGQHLVHQLGPLLCAPVPAWVCLVTASALLCVSGALEPCPHHPRVVVMVQLCQCQRARWPVHC